MKQYTLRSATAQDAKKIWQVMDTCKRQLEDQTYFICDNQYYVNDVISTSGFGVVACDTDGNIVGNLLVKYPGMEEENLGYDLAFDSHQLSRVAHMDSCSVLPSARGNHLEARMMQFAEKLIEPTCYSILLATVAPENIPSMKTLTRLGYQVMVTKEKYQGVVRNIMMKQL